MIDRHRTNLGTDPTIRCETSVWVRRKQKARNAPNTSRDDNKDSHPFRASTYSSRNTVNMANSVSSYHPSCPLLTNTPSPSPKPA